MKTILSTSLICAITSQKVSLLSLASHALILDSAKTIMSPKMWYCSPMNLTKIL